jgi:hypothetical protein
MYCNREEFPKDLKFSEKIMPEIVTALSTYYRIPLSDIVVLQKEGAEPELIDLLMDIDILFYDRKKKLQAVSVKSRRYSLFDDYCHEFSQNGSPGGFVDCKADSIIYVRGTPNEKEISHGMILNRHALHSAFEAGKIKGEIIRTHGVDTMIAFERNDLKANGVILWEFSQKDLNPDLSPSGDCKKTKRLRKILKKRPIVTPITIDPEPKKIA